VQEKMQKTRNGLVSFRTPAGVCLVFAFAYLSRAVRATPPYFATVANQALRMQGGARLAGGDLDLRVVGQLEAQVKRVMGADPAGDLNVSALRDRPDPELLRLLFLAVLGNFTSAAGAEWNRPCSLVVDPGTGLIRQQDPPQMETLALKVVLILLVAVQVRQWVSETRAQRQLEDGPRAVGLVHDPHRKGV
jgi:hypothetical protein